MKAKVAVTVLLAFGLRSSFLASASPIEDAGSFSVIDFARAGMPLLQSLHQARSHLTKRADLYERSSVHEKSAAAFSGHHRANVSAALQEISSAKAKFASGGKAVERHGGRKKFIVPQHRLAKSGKTTLQLKYDVKHLTSKHNKRSIKRSTKKRSKKQSKKSQKGSGQTAFTPSQGTAVIPLVDDYLGTDTGYYGSKAMGIGTPPQVFSMVFDTASSDIWIPGASALTHKYGSHHYYPTKDSSYRAVKSGKSNVQVTIYYGEGQVTGLVGTDVVTLGGLKVPQQYVIVATKASSDFLYYEADGIMGFAFPPAGATGQNSFFENLVAQNSLKTNMFSFYASRYATNGGQGGQLCLGCYNSASFKNPSNPTVYTAAVTTEAFWQIDFDGVGWKSGSTSTPGAITVPNTAGKRSSAIIDTGTTMIMGPPSDVAKLWATVPHSRTVPGMPGYYAYPCAQTVALPFFQIAGQAMSINGLDATIGRMDSDDSYCIGSMIGFSINPFGTEETWVLGDVFLKSWVTLYSQAGSPSVSFVSSNIA